MYKRVEAGLNITGHAGSGYRSILRRVFQTIRPAQSQEISLIFERQLDAIAVPTLGVPRRSLCKKGFPQAFVHHGKLSAGLCRLTCPHLVREVDSLEGEGFIQKANQELERQAGELSPSDFLRNANDHADVRQAIWFEVDAPDTDDGELPDYASHALTSGVAGVTAGRLDTKCLHAHLADTLCFGRRNAVGEWVIHQLRLRGISLGGTAGCEKQCDSSLQFQLYYRSNRNKSGLRQSRVRRRTAG